MLIGLEASSLQGCKSGVGYYTENLLTGMMKAEPDNRYVLFSNRPFRTEGRGRRTEDGGRRTEDGGGKRLYSVLTPTPWVPEHSALSAQSSALTRHDGHYFPVRAAWMQTALPAALRAVRPDLCHFTNYLAPLPILDFRLPILDLKFGRPSGPIIQTPANEYGVPSGFGATGSPLGRDAKPR